LGWVADDPNGAQVTITGANFGDLTENIEVLLHPAGAPAQNCTPIVVQDTEIVCKAPNAPTMTEKHTWTIEVHAGLGVHMQTSGSTPGVVYTTVPCTETCDTGECGPNGECICGTVGKGTGQINFVNYTKPGALTKDKVPIISCECGLTAVNRTPEDAMFTYSCQNGGTASGTCGCACQPNWEATPTPAPGSLTPVTSLCDSCSAPCDGALDSYHPVQDGTECGCHFNKLNLLWIILVPIFLIGAIVGGVFLYKKYSRGQSGPSKKDSRRQKAAEERRKKQMATEPGSIRQPYTPPPVTTHPQQPAGPPPGHQHNATNDNAQMAPATNSAEAEEAEKMEPLLQQVEQVE